jgi:WD40 repeat protein/serine/threonine protein kinase
MVGVMRHIPSSAALTEKVGDRIGSYKLLQLLGEGGCGVVYLAEQQEPIRRKVALKIIKLGMDTKQVIARFEAERQALAVMDHPNIAKVLDAGATETGRPFFIMELVRGIKITEYCNENHLSTLERVELFIQVCHAIQHAHQKGIIHRDIKPSNILITQHDTVAVPKIIDFGIAKATSDQPLTDKTLFTAFEQFMGTPAYMSPEQAQMSGLDIDTRTDIYSLGVLLYELLTGQTPFDARDLIRSGLDEMRRTICEKEPVRPSTRLTQELGAADVRRLKTSSSERPASPKTFRASSRRLLRIQESITRVRGDLDWIAMKCLEKDRTRRYETASGLAADLKRHLANEPIAARPPSTVYRLQKAFRRNRLAFSGAAVLGTGLILGTIVSTWQAVEASRARDVARTERNKAQAAQKEAQLAEQGEKLQRLRADAENADARLLHYGGNMIMARQAWDQNNIDGLRQLLEETEKYPDRGFEWYYWMRQTHLATLTLRGHLAAVTSAAFSQDGQRIVTGSEDKTAKLWDSATAKVLLTFAGHRARVLAVAFSQNGQRIATGSEDKTARLWDATSGQEQRTLNGHVAPITSLAFSRDGLRIVTGSMDFNAIVWDAITGQKFRTLTGHSAAITSVAIAPDGLRIATASDDQTARVWDLATGQEILRLRGHTAPVTCVAFSQDGLRIATGSDDQSVRVWDATSGRVLRTLNGHAGSVKSVAFSPDGRWILSGSWDQTAKLWDAADSHELLTFKGHTDLVRCVDFSPDGRSILTSSQDRTAKIWDLPGGDEPRTFEGDNGFIKSVAFSPDGRTIAYGDYNGMVKVRDVSGKELLSFNGRIGPITSVAFSPDGLRLITGSLDQRAKVWDAADGRELLTLNGHGAAVRPISFTPEGQPFRTGNFSVAFSADGKWIVTGSLDRSAKLWDALNGREACKLEGHTAAIRSVAFSPDSRLIVTGSDDKTAKVWQVSTGRELLTLKGHADRILSVAFSPDGERIVTAASDETARVWNARTGDWLLTLKGHRSRVLSAAFSADGQRIVTASGDTTLKVWHATTGRELLTLHGHTEVIFSALFSPDGHRIATASADQTVKLWEAALPEQVAAWQLEEQEAAEHLAAVQRDLTVEQERRRIDLSRDEGAVKRWLILGPIALAAGQSGTEGLDIEQAQNEALLRPRAGERTTVGTCQLAWEEEVLEDYVIDFNRIPGQETSKSVAYAVAYVRSESERQGVQMLVGSDDEAKVYLNGKQIYRHGSLRGFLLDEDKIQDISLKAGLNVLVFKVVNERDAWRGSIRFTDDAANPVQGIKVVLSLDASQ